MAVEKVVTPEVLAMVGKESKPETGPDEVCKSEIRRWVQSTLDGNPLWYDERYATTTPVGAGCAPAAYALRAVGFWKQPLGTRDLVREKGVDDDIRSDDSEDNSMNIPWPAGMVSFHGGDEVEYFQLPRIGDTITVTIRIVNIVEKTGRSGKLGIASTDRIYTNQRGEILAINHAGTIAREKPGTTSRG